MNARSFWLGAAGAALAAALFVSGAAGQALIQAGPTTPGHLPQYSTQGTGQAVVTDAGGAGGGVLNANPSEIGITSRGPVYPVVGGGHGPNGEHFCMYDAPTVNVTGYHVLCFDPNIGGSGIVSYAAEGGAAPQPLLFELNGTTFPLNSLTVGVTTVAGGANGDFLFENAGVLGAFAPGAGVATALGISANSPGGISTFPVAVSTLSGLPVPVPDGGTGDITFTANAPLIGNGTSAIAQGSRSGTTTVFGTVSGSPTSGNCAAWNNGNVIDAGSPCSGSGGTVILTVGTTNIVSGVNGDGLYDNGGVLGIFTLDSTAKTALGDAINTAGGITTYPPAATTLTGTLAVGHGGTGATSFTSNLPLIGGSTIGQGTVSGTTTKFGTVSGSTVDGDCAGWSSGNLIDTGAACGGGSGGGPCTTLEAFGGGVSQPGSVNSSAWVSAIATKSGNTCIQFGLGTYTFAGNLLAVLSGSNVNLSLFGTGVGSTVLYWPSGGGITLVPTELDSVSGSNFSMVTGAAGGSDAIDFSSAGENDGPFKASTFYNIEMRGDGAGHYWTWGYNVSSVSNVNIYSPSIQGDAAGGSGILCQGGGGISGSTVNLSVYSPLITSGATGIQMGSNCNAFAIHNPTISGGVTGILAPSGITGTPTGLQVIGGTINGETGWDIQLTGVVHSVSIQGVTANPVASTNGIDIGPAIGATVTGNIVACTSTTTTSGIAVNGSQTTVTGNKISTCAAGVRLGSSAATINVQSNQYTSNTAIAISASGTTNNFGNCTGVSGSCTAGATP